MCGLQAREIGIEIASILTNMLNTKLEVVNTKKGKTKLLSILPTLRMKAGAGILRKRDRENT